MWQMLQLKKECTITAENIKELKSTLDSIRQAMIQKTAGQKKYGESYETNFDDLGTLINIAICQALELYIYGGLDKLEKILTEERG